MKKLILFILFIFSYCHLNAQNIYPILLEAYQCVNEYNYNSKTDLNERMKFSLKLNKAQKKKCKIISDALTMAKFNFDTVNDTLLFDFVYEDYMVGGGPCDIYAQSSKNVKVLMIDSYK